MCGIAGFIDNNLDYDYENVLKNMVFSLKHRGPDSKNYWKSTKNFWREVRGAWNKRLDNSKNFELKTEVAGEVLYSKLFMMAEQYAQGEEEVINEIQDIIKTHSKINF